MIRAIPHKPKKAKKQLGKLRFATQICVRVQGNRRVPIWILQFNDGKTIRWEGPLQ